MTPAINGLKKSRIKHQIHVYEHDPSNSAYGIEAAEKMGVAQQQVFKTLVVMLDNQKLAVAVLPVCAQLSMKLMAKACSVKKASMADSAEVERSTGYVLGGVSPLGQKKRLKTVIDSSAQTFTSIYVSAGRRGLEIELAPIDLLKMSQGLYAEIAQANP